MPVTLNGNLEINPGRSARGEQPLVRHPDRSLPFDMLEPLVGAEAEECIPLYPVRYSVQASEEGGYAYDHPNLHRGFPALEQTAYHLAPLRAETAYIYVYDANHEDEIYAFKYDPQAGDAPFCRLKVGKRTGRLTRDSGYRAYIALPYQEGSTDTVQLIYTDTPLTAEKLKALRSNTDGLRDRLGEPVNLGAWIAAFEHEEQPAAPDAAHTLTMSELLDLWQPVRYPLAAPGESSGLDQSAAAMRTAANGNPYLAVVLHDPIGIGTELSLLLGKVMDSWQDYNAQAAHAMWASDVVDVLIWSEHERISGRAQHQAAPGIDPAFYSDAMRRNIRAREVQEWERWKSGILDEEARAEFIAAYHDHKESAEQEIRLASEQAARWWVYDGAGNPQDSLDIYDENDIESYLAMRSAAARCIVGLNECQLGRDAIAAELTEDGPTGRLARYVAGHPDIISFISPGAAAGGGASNTGLSAVVESLFETFPSDDGSRMLSTVMTGVAVERGLINSANPRLEKGLVRVGQFLEGIPAVDRVMHRVSEAARKVMVLAGVPEERVQAARLLPRETTVEWVEPRPYTDIQAGRRYQQSLERLRFWNDIQIRVGGLTVLLNGFNIMQTMEHLNDSERSSLMKVMSVGTTGVGIAASVQQLRSYQLMGRAIVARTARNIPAADALYMESKIKALSALGWGALWSFGVSFYDSSNSDDYLSEKTRELNRLGSGVQFSAGVVGGAMYFSGKFGLTKIGPRLMNVGGWVIVGLMVAYAVFATWRDRRARDDWMRAGYWGTEATLDPEREKEAFYKRFYTPQITSEGGLLGSLVRSTFVPVRIDLPGYDPHLSQVRIRSGGWLSIGGEETEVDEVEMEGDIGIARVRRLRGTLEVEYWPDVVGQPDLKLTETKTL